MTPQRWKQVDEMLEGALAHAPAERAAFLAAACGGDDELRREVESLLGFRARAEHFIETPPAELAADWVAAKETRAGQTISHYQLLSELGRGGMGVVYLARDSELGRQVALKLLPDSLTQDAARVRRFRQEARAASALSHPNIITIFEVGQTAQEAGAAHFIAAEFVDGQTLRALCQSGGLTLGAALDILIQVAGALTAAHEAGIVHRDIKPENIMLRRDGLVKVLDFGLVKLTEQGAHPPSMDLAQVTTQPGVVMGTASYMSPEQARGLDVDARSDLFSLGVVIYELLTGHTPFAGESTGDVLVALLSDEPRPLAGYVPKLPDTFQEIIKRALAKPVDQRYQTARQLGDDLKQLKEELEFAARLRGQNASQDPILALKVGAAGDAAGQSIAAGAAAASTRGRLKPLRAHLLRRGKSLAAALIALVLVIAGAMWGRQNFASRRNAIESVAVLPFEDATGDSKMEYLPDGITESLIDSLSQLPALRVMAHGTIFRYKGDNIDPREVGAALNVQAVVTGHVLRQGDQLLIRVELVDAADGARLWGDAYSRSLTDLPTMQVELARDIGQTLRLRLSGDEQRQIAKRYTQNTEAYTLYLIGRYHWNKRSGEGIRKSIDYFRQASEKDPGFALAYVGQADAYATLGSYHLIDPREALPAARAAAEHALLIDEQLADAHASLGKILTDYYWDWERAESELRRAIALNANCANAHHWYSSLLSFSGRFDEAVGEIKRARELDDSAAVNTQFGAVLYRARRYDEAIAVLRETLAQAPNSLTARIYLGLCFLVQTQYDAALAEFRRAEILAPNTPDIITLFGWTYALVGQRDQAHRYQAQLIELAKHVYVPPNHHAAIHAGLGELDDCFKWMEKAFEQRSPFISGMKTNPMYDSLRTDARFISLQRRAGLEP